MLARTHKVKKEDIVGISRLGKSYFNDLFSLKLIKEEKLQKPLFLVIVSKKNEKTLVGRNTTKRRTYAVIESAYCQFKAGQKVIIWPKKSLATEEFAVIRESLLGLLGQAGALEV